MINGEELPFQLVEVLLPGTKRGLYFKTLHHGGELPTGMINVDKALRQIINELAKQIENKSQNRAYGPEMILYIHVDFQLPSVAWKSANTIMQNIVGPYTPRFREILIGNFKSFDSYRQSASIYPALPLMVETEETLFCSDLPSDGTAQQSGFPLKP